MFRQDLHTDTISTDTPHSSTKETRIHPRRTGAGFQRDKPCSVLRLPAAAEQGKQAKATEQGRGGLGDLLHQLEAVDRKVIRVCLADAEVERDVSGAIGH